MNCVGIMDDGLRSSWTPVGVRNSQDGRANLQGQSEWGKLFALVCPPLSRLCARWFSLEREIRWVRADDSGEFSEDDWASFRYTGRHAILLRTRLVHLLGPPLLFFRLTLCVRAGRHGQPSPLAINLPRSREPLDIVVVRAGTADDQLILPDVHAETAGTADDGVAL